MVFTLFQKFVQSGNSEVSLEIALSMVVQLIGIGVGSVAVAATVCYASAFILQVHRILIFYVFFPGPILTFYVII